MQKGFTLIEIMIAVAILGLLVIIAIPLYSQYMYKANVNACMYEVKAYSNSVTYALYSPEQVSPSAPNISACRTITNASGWTVATIKKIKATTKAPVNEQIECDLPAGSPCKLIH
ncbi:pilin [Acinetobacter sp.]|uniref:pilin n=1 Tax=Acinetobacter sp. TaxID=472 RepID=UPI003AFF8CE6